jgi:hypothetical protein
MSWASSSFVSPLSKQVINAQSCGVTAPHTGKKGNEWCPMDDRKQQG